MSRADARRLLGNQPKWALRNMACALQLHPWRNAADDWNRLRALRALGYRVRIAIPTEE